MANTKNARANQINNVESATGEDRSTVLQLLASLENSRILPDDLYGEEDVALILGLRLVDSDTLNRILNSEDDEAFVAALWQRRHDAIRIAWKHATPEGERLLFQRYFSASDGMKRVYVHLHKHMGTFFSDAELARLYSSRRKSGIRVELRRLRKRGFQVESVPEARKRGKVVPEGAKGYRLLMGKPQVQGKKSA